MSSEKQFVSNYRPSESELRISKQDRERLKLSDFEFNNRGTIAISELATLHRLSHQLQQQVDDPSQVSSGKLNLYSINTNLRMYMIEQIGRNEEIEIFQQITNKLSENDIVDEIKSKYKKLYYDDTNQLIQVGINEIIDLWFSLTNPANMDYNDIFHTGTSDISEDLKKFEQILLDIQSELPKINGKPIFSILQSPQEKHPGSIVDQINYCLQNWGEYLSSKEKLVIKRSLDLYKEEMKERGIGKGEVEILSFVGQRYYDDEENFSPEHDWMSNLVLLTKNTLVWLDQLSKKYNKSITQLDQVPNEELDELQSRGITGLWLIGLWKRSSASKTIKNQLGQQDIASSAYSIYDYEISEKIGGEEALRNLKNRLHERGIKLGADMVPNHTGIFSKWIINHPEWFVQVEKKPFPSYKFTGPDLANTDEISIFLEKGYYDQSDAAVVFKWQNNRTDKVRYIYHGNDGTAYPWNDTAQLDFLNAEMREALVDKILSVADEFDIIRFDAAMVLTKEHIRRLWYPKPGSGGAIPTRAREEFELTDEEFNKLMPTEFWSEVVDRVNKDAKDTLLLAEAFWLLEGYFVKNLGMHRVYNSAFMNMLKDEENAKYQKTVRNVYEYNPEILKRFANYLTTPDEEPAIEQFGDEDKYFGITTMMVTMPGLPMFGHGQFEGLTERYGMEYKKAQVNEEERDDIIERHKIEIVPLLQKRDLFADSKHFVLYKCRTDNDEVDENVFAYSNRYNSKRSLVVYNNSLERTSGWIDGNLPQTEQQTDNEVTSIFEGLDLQDDPGYLIFKDQITELEYIRNKRDLSENGLYIELDGYSSHVFLEFREVDSELDKWTDVFNELAGKGTEDINAMFNQIQSMEEEDLVDQQKDEQEEQEEDEDINVHVRDYEDTIIDQHDEIEALRHEVADMKQRRDRYEHELEQKEKNINKQQHQISTLERSLEEIKEQNEMLSEEIDRLKSANQSLKERIGRLTEKKDKEREAEKVKVETKQSAKSDQAISKLETKVDQTTTKNKELESRIDELTDTVEDLKMDKKLLQKENKEWKKENKKLQKELKELRDEYSSTIEEIKLPTERSPSDVQRQEDESPVSSDLVEDMVIRLSSFENGLSLRSLAMSLGVNMQTAMEHVSTLEDRGWIDIQRDHDNDDNPKIILTK